MSDTSRAVVLSTAFVAALAGGACELRVDDSNDSAAALCDDAQAHLQSCFPEHEIGEPDSCNQGEAETVLDLSCDELRAGEGGKADWSWCTAWTWWLCGSSASSEIIIDHQLHPSHADTDETYLYWTTHGLWQEEPGTVSRARKDGSGSVEVLFQKSEPREIAVDDTYVYWTIVDREDGNTYKLNRMPKAGGEVELLADAADEIESLAQDEQYLYTAIDAEITRIDKDDLSRLVLANAQTATRMVSDGAYLYWKNGFGPGSIERVPVSGGAVEQVVPLAGATGLAIDDEYVYWFDDEVITRTPKSGGEPQAIYDTEEYSLSDITVAGESVYWVEAVPGHVHSVRVDGTDASSLASNQEHPKRLIQDGTHLFWVNDGTTTSWLDYLNDGNIRSMEK